MFVHVIRMDELLPAPISDLLKRQAGVLHPLRVEVVHAAVRLGGDEFLRDRVQDEPLALFGLSQCVFRLLALGDVLNGEQDQVGVVFHRPEAAGIEQHDLLANRREVDFHIEVVNGIVVGQNFIQQRPQLR